jgi:hypothetical protein
MNTLQSISKRAILTVLTVTAIFGGFFVAGTALAEVTVAPTLNGENISIDTTSAGEDGVFTSLTSWRPSINNENGDIAIGTHTINLPDGWEFDTSSTISIMAFNDIVLESTTITPEQTSFSFIVTGVSTYDGSVSFNGLKVRPTGATPSIGNITYSGPSGITGVGGSTNFGTLSTIPGVVTQLAFEAQPGDAVYGSPLNPQPVVVTQDQFGNNSTNGLAETEMVSLSLTGTGVLVGTTELNIGTGDGNGTVIFTNVTADAVGTGNEFTASADGLDPTVSDTFDITQKPLTATVTVDEKDYDGNDSAIINTITLEGIVEWDGIEDTVSADFSDFSVATANFVSENAGTHAISTKGVVLDGADKDNYTLDNTAITGEGTINPLGITGSFTAENKVYDGTTAATVSNRSLTGVLPQDEGDVILIGGTASFTDQNVGEGIQVTASGMTLDGSKAGNYSLTIIDSTTANITKVLLTITADDKSREYGELNPELTASYGGFVNGEDESVLDTPVELGTIADQMSPVNNYEITASGATDANYDITLENGILTVTSAPLTVTADAQSKTYGEADPLESTYTATGFKNDDDESIFSGSLERGAGEDVGDYPINKGTLSAGINYEIFFTSANLTINQRPLTVTAVTDTKVYDGTTNSDGTPEITEGSLVNGDLPNFIQAFDNKNVGTEKTLMSDGSVNDGNDGNNYNVIFFDVSTGEITEAPLSATVTVQKKVVDETTDAEIIGVELDDVIPDDVVTVLDQGTAIFADSTVGTHAVIATGVTITGVDTGNYAFDGIATGIGEILPVPTIVYVNNDWAGTEAWTDPDGEEEPATYFSYDAFDSIQDAINALSENGTVNVAAGTYNESVLIEKQLTLTGPTEGVKPVITGVDGTNYIIKINGVDGVTINNLEVNGEGSAAGDNAFDYGIWVDNSGTESTPVEISNSAIKNIWKTSSNGIEADNGSYVLIHNNTVSSFHKRGIRFINSEGKVYGNEVVGDNVDGTSRVQNLVNLWGGSTVEIYGNDLHNALTNPEATPTWDSPGIFVSSYGGDGPSQADIHDNEIYNCDSGIIVGSYYADTDTSSAIITDNNLHNLGWAINFEKGTISATITGNTFSNVSKAVNSDDSNGGPEIKPTVNAEGNYWGTAVLSTIQDLVYDEVNFDPYYIDGEMTILSDVIPTIVYIDDNYIDGNAGDHYFGYNAFNTIQEGIDAVAAGGIVNVLDGQYEETITINRPLTLSGAKNGENNLVVLTSNGGNTITVSNTNDVVIENLDFVSPDGAGTLDSIALNSVDGVTIRGCNFDGQERFIGTLQHRAIQMSSAENITVDNSNFEDGYYVTIQGYVNTLIVKNSTIENCKSGINLQGGSNLEVINTIISVVAKGDDNDTYAVRFNGNNMTISDSTFNVNKAEFMASEGTFHSAVVARAEASGTLLVEGSIINGEVVNLSETQITAENNWWGATVPSFDSIIIGDNVDYDPWYLDEEMEMLSSDIGRANIYVDGSYTEDIPEEDLYFGFNAFATIQEGINAVDEGGIVNVAAGTYNEAIVIDKPLTLRGATYDINKNGYTVPADYAWDDTIESIINHPNPDGGYDAVVDIYDVTNVTLEGFVVQELNAEANKNTSLVRVRAQTKNISVNIRNNIIGPNTNVENQDGTHGRMGLYLINNPYNDQYGIVDSIIAGNKIFDAKGNGNNIFLWSSYESYEAPGSASMSGTIIEDNEIYGSHRTGIETAGGYTGLTIRDNKIYNNGGMFEADANNLKYGNGILLIRGAGDSHSDTVKGFGPEDLTIENNEIFGNQKSGIYMGPISKNYTIAGNKIYNNGWDGMRLDLVESYNNPDFEEGDRIPWADQAEDIIAQSNRIYGNGEYGIQVIGEPTNDFILDATFNWWGTIDGATITSQISDSVDYRPWCTEETCTVEDYDPPTVDEGLLVPSNMAVGIDPTEDIVITFSEDVNFDSGNISISGTVNVSGNIVTVTPIDLENNTEYTITLSGVADLAGNIMEDYEWSFTTATRYEISLEAGWNLISLPVTPTTWTSTTEVLASVSGSVERVWSYDAVAGTWSVYNADGAPGNLDTMIAGHGYWIKTTNSDTLTGVGTLYEQFIPSGETDAPSTPPQIPLAKGWNLIGYYQLPGETTATISNALSTLNGAWTGSSQHLMTFTKGSSPSIKSVSVMNPGEGYWIFMTDDRPYTFGSSAE